MKYHSVLEATNCEFLGVGKTDDTHHSLHAWSEGFCSIARPDCTTTTTTTRNLGMDHDSYHTQGHKYPRGNIHSQ